MSNVTGQIRSALTRKFGPLPAYAWLLILGGAVFLYRTARGQYAGAVDDAAAADDGGADLAEPPDREPFTLGPGESVYDPNTGQLVSGAPEQQPAPEAPEPPRPTILKPGQSAILPNGNLVTAPVPKPPKKKRKPKPKPGHGRRKKPAPRGKHPRKPKPRGGDKVKNPKPRRKHKPPHPRNTPGGKKRPLATKLTPTRARSRTVAKPAGVMRQRPAASHPRPSHDARSHPKASAPRTRRRKTRR